MKNVILTMVAVVFVFTANAQKVKHVHGKLDFLKGQTELKIVFTYDNMMIGKMTAEDYVNKKVTDKNDDSSGAGDEWQVNWQNDLDTTYPRKFIKSFNVRMNKKEVSLDRTYDDAEYIIMVNTIFVEPGYNVGISSKRASANMEVTIVSKDAPDDILVKLTISKSPGNSFFGANYSIADRVGGCYQNAALSLGSYFISKKVF